jgi:hypothetical protein
VVVLVVVTQFAPLGGYHGVFGSDAHAGSESKFNATFTALGNPLAMLITALVVRPIHANPPTSAPNGPGVPDTSIGSE